LIHRWSSPVAGSAAASGIAAAEAPETVPGIEPAEPAAAAAAHAGAAAHQVAEDQPRNDAQPSAAPSVTARTAGAHQQHEEKNAADDYGPGKAIGESRPRAPRRQVGLQLHVLGLGDGVADSLGGRHQGVADVILAHGRTHLAQDIA